MGRKSSIDRMSPDVKAYIQAMLATGSQTLDELIADLQERFPTEASKGELPSRSALHRYGAKLDRRLNAIRASTEAARLIREHAGDDEDARSEALVAMVQTELFDAILLLQEADDPEADPGERVTLLSKAAKNIATLTRSSVNLKQFQAKVEAEARKKALADAAATAETTAKAQGLSAGGVAALRAAIMGAM
ncbi:DUF3486 family protein [Comamonas aquatica]|uniref:phage protein Gp27 family protein n=1 Tax=Comamonas aquatica TaxID=225991 RepID=UPI00244A9D4C|nr:phage protein Gp27 family protein [Comamonas aquatica]MDH0494259.1 DUF3486 family protein [Comamonas aquatica]MDH1766264.1 DUF3486 family protein [Comamonas aquatica]